MVFTLNARIGGTRLGASPPLRVPWTQAEACKDRTMATSTGSGKLRRPPRHGCLLERVQRFAREFPRRVHHGNRRQDLLPGDAARDAARQARGLPRDRRGHVFHDARLDVRRVPDQHLRGVAGGVRAVDGFRRGGVVHRVRRAAPARCAQAARQGPRGRGGAGAARGRQRGFRAARRAAGRGGDASGGGAEGGREGEDVVGGGVPDVFA